MTDDEAQKLKLFVFTEFEPYYTDGLAFAIAESEKEARELIKAGRSYTPDNWGNLRIYPLTEKVAYSISGG